MIGSGNKEGQHWFIKYSSVVSIVIKHSEWEACETMWSMVDRWRNKTFKRLTQLTNMYSWIVQLFLWYNFTPGCGWGRRLLLHEEWSTWAKINIQVPPKCGFYCHKILEYKLLPWFGKLQGCTSLQMVDRFSNKYFILVP